jgi:hypothetical protein
LPAASRESTLEALDPLQQCCWAVVGLGAGQPDQCDLQRHSRVDRVPHLGQRLTNAFHRPHEGGGSQAAGLLLDPDGGVVGKHD